MVVATLADNEASSARRAQGVKVDMPLGPEARRLEPYRHGRQAGRAFDHRGQAASAVDEVIDPTFLDDDGLHKGAHLRSQYKALIKRIVCRRNQAVRRWAQWAMRLCTSSSLRTLHTIAWMRPAHAAVARDLTAASSFACLREQMKTSQPRARSSRATWKPMPVPPPVTIAVFPAKRSVRNTEAGDGIG